MFLRTAEKYLEEIGGHLKQRGKEREVTLHGTRKEGGQQAEGANPSACAQTVLSSGARAGEVPRAEQPGCTALQRAVPQHRTLPGQDTGQSSPCAALRPGDRQHQVSRTSLRPRDHGIGFPSSFTLRDHTTRSIPLLSPHLKPQRTAMLVTRRVKKGGKTKNLHWLLMPQTQQDEQALA